MAVNWSEMIPDILVAIGKEIPYYEDLLTFAEVCTNWRTAADDCLSEFRGFCQFPCLLLPERREGEEEGEREKEERQRQRQRQGNFFFLRSGKVGGGVLMPSTTAAGKRRRRRCIPTSHGWILTYVRDVSRPPTLLHPFWGREIELPKFTTMAADLTLLDNRFLHIIHKVALSSSDPSSPDFLVMVIWNENRRLGFCRPGDVSWAVTEMDASFCFFDICYHNARLYAVSFLLDIFVCDVHGPHPTKLQLIKALTRDSIPFTRYIYIVKSGLDDDTFLLVSRGNQPYYEGIDGYVSIDGDDVITTDEDEDKDVEEEEINRADIREYLSNEFAVDDDGSDEEIDSEVDVNDEDDSENKFLIFKFSLKDDDRCVELDNLGGDRALF